MFSLDKMKPVFRGPVAGGMHHFEDLVVIPADRELPNRDLPPATAGRVNV